jgi:hypothetical protein
MYRWYENAQVCYAYLPGVRDHQDREVQLDQFAKSLWFTRGWTLQELVAPRRVVFFGGDDWFEIGTRDSLQVPISEITKIDTSILRSNKHVFKASIAQRMSWASKRNTTKQEDIAYCLLGIFNVNMPLLYGEGENAFMRLQLELLNVPNDHTIFAWSIPAGEEIPERPPPTSGLYKGAYGSNLGSNVGGLGLLAPSVAEFSNCGNIIQSREISSSSHYMTNIGLCITLPTVLVRKRASAEYHAFLDCYRAGHNMSEESPWRICLSLRHEGNSRFYRISTGERLLKERDYWARMTPMFITRTRSDCSLSGSSRAYSNPENSVGSENCEQNPRSLPHDFNLHKAWSSHVDQETPEDETTPLLRDVETGLASSTSFNHYGQILISPGYGRWAHWLTFALQNISGFLVAGSIKILVLLIFVPLGVFAGAASLNQTIVFVFNFLAIMGLAPLLTVATTNLSAKLGYTLGGLINAIFGNAVEMIVSFG